MAHSFAFIQFIDQPGGNAHQLAQSLGMHAVNTNASTTVYINNQLCWIIQTPHTNALKQLFKKHAAHPFAIAFQDNSLAPQTNLEALLTCDNDHAVTFYNTLTFKKVSHNWRALLQLPPHDKANNNNAFAIDHCAIACRRNQLHPFIQQLTQNFSLQTGFKLDVDNGSSGMRSQVMHNHSQTIRLPLVSPDGPNSQIQQFIDQHHECGIQHIGIKTNNIFETVRQMKQQNIEFLNINASYYDSEYFQQLPFSDDQKKQCQQLGILVDHNSDGGYLMQLFTKPLLGAMMIEVIERHNHDSFGAKNIKSLFESVAENATAAPKVAS